MIKKVIFLFLLISSMLYCMDGVDEVRLFKEGLGAVCKAGKWGFVNKEGKIVIPIKYDAVIDFSEGLCGVKNRQNKWKYIDKTGKDITMPIYDDVSAFKDGLARVWKDDKYGYIGKDGKEKTRFYTMIFNYKEDVAVANQGGEINEDGNVSGGNFFYIDKEGKRLSEKTYDDCYDFSNGIGMYKSGNKYGFVDKTGKEITTAIFTSAKDFTEEGVAAVEFLGKWGYIDKTGKPVIAPKFDYGFSFFSGVASVGKGVKIDNDTGDIYEGKFRLIDKTGKYLSKEYDMIYDNSKGVNIVKLEGRYSLINETGKEITPLDYTMIYEETEGVFSAQKYDGAILKEGYIDKTGKEVIPFIYDEAFSFEGGSAVVRYEDGYGLINKKGESLINKKHEKITYTEDRQYLITLDGEEYDENGETINPGYCGLIDKSGKTILEPKYDSVYGMSEGIAAVSKNGKSWYVYEDGKEMNCIIK